MNKSVSTLLSVVVAVALLVAGLAVGIFFEKQITAPKLEKASALITAINSNLFPSVVAFGQVKKIDGNKITLASGGEELVISVKSSAKLTSLKESTAGGAASQKKIELKDVLVNDYVNIGIEVASDGEIQGNTVLVLPMTIRS